MEKDLIALMLALLPGATVTPVARTQGSPLPAVVIQRVSGGPEYADDGEVGLLGARVQVDCWGETYAAAKDQAIAVRGALSALRDRVQGATTFIYVTLEDERDTREPGYNNAEYLFRTSLDFDVWSSP